MRPARRGPQRSQRSARREACRRARTSRARWWPRAPLPDCGAAFDRWLGRGKPGHVAGDWPELAEATAWIVAAGGKAVIAHPMRYPLSAGARRELCAEFAAAGGRGVEVVTGGGGPRDREQAISLAVRCQLEGSVGLGLPRPRRAMESAGSIG